MSDLHALAQWSREAKKPQRPEKLDCTQNWKSIAKSLFATKIWSGLPTTKKVLLIYVHCLECRNNKLSKHVRKPELSTELDANGAWYYGIIRYLRLSLCNSVRVSAINTGSQDLKVIHTKWKRPLKWKFCLMFVSFLRGRTIEVTEKPFVCFVQSTDNTYAY